MKGTRFGIVGLAVMGAVMVTHGASASENDVLQLSPRERDQVVGRYVRPDGRTVPLVENQGIPFLYGLGDVRGKASSVPLVNGKTSSIEASTPSHGIVPGQEPE